jgi:hypothetical protein
LSMHCVVANDSGISDYAGLFSIIISYFHLGEVMWKDFVV